MDLKIFRSMDSQMLYSILNMKLRNDYRDIEDLCRSLDLDRSTLLERMTQAGYVYDNALRQFRPV